MATITINIDGVVTGTGNANRVAKIATTVTPGGVIETLSNSLFIDDGTTLTTHTDTIGINLTAFTAGAGSKRAYVGADANTASNTNAGLYLVSATSVDTAHFSLSELNGINIKALNVTDGRPLVVSASGYMGSSATTNTQLAMLSDGQQLGNTGYFLQTDGAGTLSWQAITPGTGTVQTISIETKNGFAGATDGDPTNPLITLTTTISGILVGDGSTMSAALDSDIISALGYTPYNSANPSSFISLSDTLAGLSITGSSITTGSSVIGAFGALQNQINGILGGAVYQGVWNATTNTPTLSDGTGTKGHYYVVSVAGTQNLGSGSITFDVGDWAIHNGTVYQKVDNTDAVSSVNGAIGAVVVTTTGTSNRITVSGGTGLTPTIDISSSYVGQSSITTVGTLASGAVPASLITAGTFGAGAYTMNTSLTVGSGVTGSVLRTHTSSLHAAIFSANVTASSTNYTLYFNGISTAINATSAGSLILANNNSTVLSISSGVVTIADNIAFVANATNGVKWGNTTSGKQGWYNATPVIQQTDGTALTNNVTSGGTTNTIDNWTDLVIYANDAAAIRNAIYQLARKLKITNDAMRTYGFLS